MPFTPRSLEFLFENRILNNRDWFLEHKSEYQQVVVAPMAELVEALEPTLHAIDPHLLCDPRGGKSISRIYRDVRFSRDKSLYRDTAWCVFMRDKKLYNGLPGYFFEISPAGFRYGCGYYTTSNESLEAIRTLILRGERSAKEALCCFEKQDVFSLEGDCYKRSRHPDQPEALRAWLDRKNICLIHNEGDLSLLFSEELAHRVSCDFEKIAPIYRFLMNAEAFK